MSTAWIVEAELQYHAGQDAPSGCYCRTDVSSGRVIVHEGGLLPASHDGQRAVYVRVRPWSVVHLRPQPPSAA